MSPGDYAECALVRRTTADQLHDKLDWESAYAYNNETFGSGGMLGRTPDCEVVPAAPTRTTTSSPTTDRPAGIANRSPLCAVRFPIVPPLDPCPFILVNRVGWPAETRDEER